MTPASVALLAATLASAALIPAVTGDPRHDRPVSALVAASPPAGGVEVTARAGWRWPLKPRPAVVRRFAVGPHPWSPGHRGVDLAAGPGQQVQAPTDGVVRFAGVVAGRPVLSLGHASGLRTTYEPVRSTVAVGSTVRAGQVVGVLDGSSHCDPAMCLHWGALRGQAYIDPLALVGARPLPILLPVGPAPP